MACSARKSSVTSRLAKKKPKIASSYWDRVDFSLGPGPSFLPDEWYLKVAWATVAIIFVAFLNMQATSAG